MSFLFFLSVICFIETGIPVLAIESSSRVSRLFDPIEKRGNPTYDAEFDKFGIPHFRVFFWIPKDATKLTPYADPGVNTKVWTHGSVEKWSVVKTNTFNNNEQLVFIYVPKTFVLFYGKGFEKVIHLDYK